MDMILITFDKLNILNKEVINMFLNTKKLMQHQ